MTNVDVTPGTGKTVATETIATVEYQKIKLIDATAASTSATGVAANPLQVSLANTAANSTAVKVDGSAVVQPVSDNSGSLTVDNAGTFATQATLQTGTNSVGKISDITTSVVPGTGATNLGKAEDAAHTSGDTGVMALGVRNEAIVAISGADGDHTPVATGSAGEVMIGFAPLTARTSGTGTTTGTSGVSVISAPGANIYLYITDIMVANTGAATSLITFQLDPAGTPTTLGYTIAPAGGGSNIHFNTPMKVTTANKAFGFTAATASTTIYVTALGFTSKV